MHIFTWNSPVVFESEEQEKAVRLQIEASWGDGLVSATPPCITPPCIATAWAAAWATAWATAEASAMATIKATVNPTPKPPPPPKRPNYRPFLRFLEREQARAAEAGFTLIVLPDGDADITQYQNNWAEESMKFMISPTPWIIILFSGDETCLNKRQSRLLKNYLSYLNGKKFKSKLVRQFRAAGMSRASIDRVQVR